MAEMISPSVLADCLRFATDWLNVYKKEINALNVYPVPDGDTGTNMHLTMQSVRRELDIIDTQRMDEVARAMSYGSLLGARGNSGVILSQFLKGFSDAVRDKSRLGAVDLVLAFERGAKSSYAAVMTPVEGTILTVAREAAEGGRRALELNPKLSALELLQAVFSAGQESLNRTPELLSVLRQANVVDSGGSGLMRLIEGIIAKLESRELPEAPSIEHFAAESFEPEEFGYCTEFLLEQVALPIEEMRALIAPFGDSLLVVGAEGFVKGHIHTDEPDELLATVSRHGRMVRSKVEDMAEQHTEILSLAGAAAKPQVPRTGMIAVVSGYGLIKVFRSLGARIISGGQTQNPSVQDIIDAARSLESADIIVLPNNKNVILAAEQAKTMLKEKTLHVVATRTLGQGLGAALAFDPEGDPLLLSKLMLEAGDRVLTFEVTRASRDAIINKHELKSGETIGLRDDELIYHSGTPEEAVVTMLKNNYTTQEIVTIFSGPNVDRETLEHLEHQIRTALPQLEVEVHIGGPDLYDYLVTLE